MVSQPYNLHAMNTPSLTNQQLHTPKQSQKGFALIATVSIMALLVLIVVGMLALSSSETRKATQSEHQLIAQANARLALTIAIGKLQEAAGPDQRVTATADIHPDRSDDKKHLTGVWSTEGWDPQEPNTKKFITWLGSVPNTDPNVPTVEDSETALQPFANNSKLVTLAGTGSLGTGSLVTDHVKVATVPIVDNSNNHTGSYAYWIADESIKASYSVPVKPSPSDWNKAAHSTSPYKAGMELIDASIFDDYSTVAKSDKIHTPTIQTADLNHPSASPPSKQYFHDLSNRSISLFTNTRLGGLKSDLSTAFELDLADFEGLPEFHDSTENNNTNLYSVLGSGSDYNIAELYPSSHQLGYLFEVPVNTTDVVRGPTWDLLRNFYRLYKKEWETVSWPRQRTASSAENLITRGSLPLSYSSDAGGSNPAGKRSYGTRNSPGALYDSWAGAFKSIAEPISSGPVPLGTSTIRPTAQRIAPSVLRVTWVVGARLQDLTPWGLADPRLTFSFDPYVTIHNPYNRPIEFESIAMYSAKFNPLRFNITYTDLGGSTKTLEDLMFSVNTGNNGSFGYRIFPTTGQTFTLEPGEIKVLSPPAIGGPPKEFEVTKNNQLMEATFAYGENSGYFLHPGGYHHGFGSPLIQPAPGSSVDITMSGRTTGFANGEMDTFTFSLLSTKHPDGTSTDLKTDLPPYMGINNDVWDDDFMTRLTFSTFDNVGKSQADTHKLSITKSFNMGSLPPTGQGGFFIGALDISMKHGGEDAPIFHQFNPRAQIYDPRNYDGVERMSPAWKVELTDITDISDLELVANTASQGHWGLGNTAAAGTTHVVLKDLPRSPLTSLASLTHADISIIPGDGTSQIGNSFIPPAFTAAQSNKLVTKRTTNTQYKITDTQQLTDFSWASNEALWDQYFFSGINWGSTSLAYQGSSTQENSTQGNAVAALRLHDKTAPNSLANSRYEYVEANTSTTSQLDSEINDYSKIGRHLICLGGFNVNSTSVNAWKAVLGSLNDAEVAHLVNGTLSNESSADTPFTRYQLPAGSKDDNANEGSELTGYRSLTKLEIGALAESIVKQVKIRGPFIGLSDFVNRRLEKSSSSSADIDKLGALQMAIEDAGINDSVGSAATLANMETTSINTGTASKPISTMTGAPGYLMQSDVLTSIGSILRTRGDTFTVRTYGESVDSAGKIQAKAWCEAVIQRTPEWTVDSTVKYKVADPDYPDLSTTTTLKKWIDNSNVDPTNKRLGRKMKIVSFRWLSAGEI